MVLLKGIALKVLINYANQAYEPTRKLNTWTGYHIAKFDRVIEYTPDDIDEEFTKENKLILERKRGAGEWLWKPYFILKTLRELEYGDYLFYLDSGAFFIHNLSKIWAILEHEDIWITHTPLVEEQFTKQLAFKKMKCQDEKITKSVQATGGILAFKVSASSMAFVETWLQYCKDPELLLAPDDVEQEIPSFISHREDQSILSLLAKKAGLPFSSDPTQYGNFPEKYAAKDRKIIITPRTEYSTLIILHRQRKPTFKVICNQLIEGFIPRKFGLWMLAMRN